MRLAEICEINPKGEPLDDASLVSFVGMSDVSEDGKIEVGNIRPCGEVKKGFTAFKEDDVLFAKITPCMENGKGALAVGLTNGIGYGSTEFHVLRPKRDVAIGKWLYYLTAWPVFRANAAVHMTGSAGQKRVPKSFLEMYELAVPSTDIQSQQSANLDRVRKVLDLRRAQLSALDELAKARFVEMFGKAKGRWPEVTIAKVCQRTRTGPFGSALHHDEFVESGVFVLGIDNAVENRFAYNRMRYITPEKYQQLKRYTVHPGDVIITIMGTIGRSAVIPPDMPTAINTKHLACLTPDFEKVNSTFLCSAFQMHPEIRCQLASQTKGAIMDGLNLGIINGLKFHLPPLDLQNRFAAFASRVESAKASVERALEETQTLFDSLMQKYFGF